MRPGGPPQPAGLVAAAHDPAVPQFFAIRRHLEPDTPAAFASAVINADPRGKPFRFAADNDRQLSLGVGAEAALELRARQWPAFCR